MTSRSVKATSAKIFENLKNSKEYHNGFVKQKRHIITQLLAIKNELIQFAKTPGRPAYQVNGLLVEHCARFSNQLPKNTPKAQYISEVIINHLHGCELSNPDYIWLKIQGRRMTFTGIGEVKSHPFNIAHQPRQLFFQETNIRNLIKCGEIPSPISKRYHAVFADIFMRYLILPRSTHAPHTLPASAPLGWEIKEIEFTLPEIIFLRRQLCGNTLLSENLDEYNSSYSPEEYESFAYNIVTQVEEIIADLFRNLIPIDQKEIQNALAMWSIIYGSIPINRESIDLVTQWTQATIPHCADMRSLVSIPPSSLIGLDAKKNAPYHSLIQYATANNILLARTLISRLQEIKQYLPDPPELTHKQEIDIFGLL